MQNEIFIAFVVGWAAAICFTIIGGFIEYFFSCMTGKTATNFDIRVSPAFLSEIARSKPHKHQSYSLRRWLCLEWEKTKVKKLELEKIVCITKCRLKELDNENHKEIEKLKEINKKL